MFDILVYLYETYHRPDVLPEPDKLAESLSEIGFRESEIKDALIWLTDLVDTTEDFAESHPEQNALSLSQRIYVDQEQSALGSGGIGFIQSLVSAKVLDPIQREIVIERAIAANEFPMTLDKLRLIVLVILWGQGQDPDESMLDMLFPHSEDQAQPLLH
jgi:Smg protein